MFEITLDHGRGQKTNFGARAFSSDSGLKNFFRSMTQMSSPEAAKRFISFINASPTPFHAIQNAAIRLEKAGFTKVRGSLSVGIFADDGQIKEKDDWEHSLKPGSKYYFTRNQSALLAFTIPKKWKQGTGVSIVATHVDSPNLRVSGEYENLKNAFYNFDLHPPRFVPSRNAPSPATSK